MANHRLHLLMPEDLKQAMDGYTEEVGNTITDLVRRSVRLFLHLHAAQKRGAVFTVTERNGEKSRFVIN